MFILVADGIVLFSFFSFFLFPFFLMLHLYLVQRFEGGSSYRSSGPGVMCLKFGSGVTCLRQRRPEHKLGSPLSTRFDPRRGQGSKPSCTAGDLRWDANVTNRMTITHSFPGAHRVTEMNKAHPSQHSTRGDPLSLPLGCPSN